MVLLCATCAAGTPGKGLFQPPVPFPIRLAAFGPDQLQSVVAGPEGSFYAAGWRAFVVGGPRHVVVVRIAASGQPDAAFGDAGIASTGLTFAGGSDEVDIALQDGRPVVSATVPSAIVAGDRDVAVVRLLDNGAVDTSFADAGYRILDLNVAIASAGSDPAPDGAHALAVGTDGSLYLHANARAAGLREDLDMVLVKLTPSGDLDPEFHDDGIATLDIQGANESARSISVLGDGSVLATGYANTIATMSVQPVVYRLTPQGLFEPGFATDGLFHEVVLAEHTEVFSAVLVDGALVTCGSGRDAGDINAFVSLRFAAQDGERDAGWGGAANGAVLVDPSATMSGNTCRAVVALPGGGVALLGSAGPSGQPAQDAAYVILTAQGTLDTAFGTGVETFVFEADGHDQFWAGAYNAGQALFVGYKGAGSTQSEASNDDAWAVLLPLASVFADGFEAR